MIHDYKVSNIMNAENEQNGNIKIPRRLLRDINNAIKMFLFINVFVYIRPKYIL